MRRKTQEVEIEIEPSGNGIAIDTGDRILDHMLKTFFFYLGRNVEIHASWDLRHHLWEDMGISIGEFLDPGKTNIARFGNSTIPMDDALVTVAADISRPYLNLNLEYEDSEGFDISLVREFYWALARTMDMTLHIVQVAGFNSHHLVEASFKASGNALALALGKSERMNSTKGVLR